jgi:hypothetical protein
MRYLPSILPISVSYLMLMQSIPMDLVGAHRIT